jgi:hypothetical protein
MADRKAFLLRIEPKLLAAVQRWADDDLRSLNAQIEFLLRNALRDSGRSKDPPHGESAPGAGGAPERTKDKEQRTKNRTADDGTKNGN